MFRKVLAVGAIATACVLSFAPAAMADDWRYVESSMDKHKLEAECDAGKAFGGWNECNITEDNGYHLFVR
ncbi:hypothetical protein [Amycolatopsis pigmentata]|uniref:Uncharacterized protein n=1 Tax=Amycolatopsis pigmentata TaxID=450801 RepID=A0ABW5FV22_9PSEU